LVDWLIGGLVPRWLSLSKPGGLVNWLIGSPVAELVEAWLIGSPVAELVEAWWIGGLVNWLIG